MHTRRPENSASRTCGSYCRSSSVAAGSNISVEGFTHLLQLRRRRTDSFLCYRHHAGQALRHQPLVGYASSRIHGTNPPNRYRLHTAQGNHTRYAENDRGSS